MCPHMEGSDPLIEGFWGLKSLGFEGPRVVGSVWVYIYIELHNFIPREGRSRVVEG